MSILLKSNSIKVYDGTTQKNQINIFQENNLQNMNNVISSIETIQSKISDIDTIRAGAAKGATSIQSLSGYATTDWVNQQGFLKSHQSLAGYATTDWVNNNYQPRGNYADANWVNSNFQTKGNLSINEMACGRVGPFEIPANSSDARQWSIGFGKTFSSAPYVICSPYSETMGKVSGAMSATSYAVTTTGCGIRVKTNDNPKTSTFYVDWIAIL